MGEAESKSEDKGKTTTIRFYADMQADSQYLKDYFKAQGLVISETELVRYCYNHVRRSIEDHEGRKIVATKPLAGKPKPSVKGRKRKGA